MIRNISGTTHSSRLRDRRLVHTHISGIVELQKIYTIEEVLGKGNFGTVVKAFHKESQVFWAIKIVNKKKTGESRVKLVEREILILRLVQHPNIIYLHCVYESPKTIYLVFELCISTLAKLFKKKNKSFEEREIVIIIRSLASALAYLHKNDIVHRDLKLENILISNSESEEQLFIKVSDFGLSAMRGGPGHEKMLHEFCGTLVYMAPEVITTKSYSQQCDVWSMGVIMYVLLFGKFPFFSHDHHKLCKMISKSEINFSELCCSEEARNLMSKLLEKNSAFRITAAETEQHPFISNAGITLKTQSSNVLDMMRMWKKEMLANSTENEPLNLDSSKVHTSEKEDSILSTDWDHGSANSSSSGFKSAKPTKPKCRFQFPKRAPTPNTNDPSTSKGQTFVKSVMSRSSANFEISTCSNSSLGDLENSSLKGRFEKSRRRSSMLPDFSYVSAKVDTNLNTRKNNQGKKNSL